MLPLRRRRPRRPRPRPPARPRGAGWGAGGAAMAALLAVAGTSIILVTTWGGTQYPWRSWQIIGLGALGLVAAVAFILVEARAAEPILPEIPAGEEAPAADGADAASGS